MRRALGWVLGTCDLTLDGCGCLSMAAEGGMRVRFVVCRVKTRFDSSTDKKINRLRNQSISFKESSQFHAYIYKTQCRKSANEESTTNEADWTAKFGDAI